ncbi:DUF4279 domain-containing protein [Burkholderia anthina]|uniref:DUF4279 domain-containing protein n=1 Tax=Burkholderia anthina TaxID=179879 RepID=UPI0037C193AD
MSFHQLAHASFSISGDHVVPEFWTEYFGVVPDLAISKGDPVIDPTGQGRVLTRRTGVWSFRSKDAVRSDSLEPHLRYLVERLSLPRPDLRVLVERAGARMRFFCYWDNERCDRMPDVPGDIREMMASLGGTVEIDEYR